MGAKVCHIFNIKKNVRLTIIIIITIAYIHFLRNDMNEIESVDMF